MNHISQKVSGCGVPDRFRWLNSSRFTSKLLLAVILILFHYYLITFFSTSSILLLIGRLIFYTLSDCTTQEILLPGVTFSSAPKRSPSIMFLMNYFIYPEYPLVSLLLFYIIDLPPLTKTSFSIEMAWLMMK